MLLLSCLIALSCQSTTRVGDRYYEKGRFPEAAAAFEVYLESAPGDDQEVVRTLYRLGVIYAMPGTRVEDRGRSIEVLERVQQEFPGSPYAAEARLLQGLQEGLAALEADAAKVGREIEDLEAVIVRREERLRALEEELDGREEEISTLADSIPPLEARIRILAQELRDREEELEQLEKLKAIDLREPPP